MLEALDLTRTLSKSEYRKKRPWMQNRLHRLQRACWEAKIATVVVFEGWDAAGKGTAINKLTQRLEPRGFSLHAIREPRTSETCLPWMWRFWVRLPNWGEMALFDRSWYRRVVDERVEERIKESDWEKAFDDILSFERALADDRYLISKFFLHISKKEQAKRFKELESDRHTAWHVEKEDWKHHRKYDEYRDALEEMLERTDCAWAPWTLIEATDRRWARIRIFDTLIRCMEEGLQRHGCQVPESPPEPGARGDDQGDEKEED